MVLRVVNNCLVFLKGIIQDTLYIRQVSSLVAKVHVSALKFLYQESHKRDETSLIIT